MDYYLAETIDIENEFNLEELLSFQLNHDVQIIRDETYQYMCYIDKEVYATALTTLGALVYGIKIYKNESNTRNTKAN